MSKNALFFTLILLLLQTTRPVQAVWFEAQGQAAIENGNKQLARQNATQEAIKQALLFAGASIKSVQKMANGLLQDDNLEIRAAGEVNQIELIEERYQNNVVTVSIRADIFSQQTTCNGSDYQKTVATTYFPILHREQATVGNLFDLGSQLPKVLEQNFTLYGEHAQINYIGPFYPAARYQQSDNHITLIARQANSQYVLLGEVNDISVQTTQPSGWALWQSPQHQRQFAFNVALYDGQTGASIWTKQYKIDAPWQFELHESVDVSSSQLWQSSYGEAIDGVMQDISQQVDETLSCLPAYGRVMFVQNEQLKINIGEKHGVQQGDELTLYQVNQFHDPQGQLHAQFYIHPSKIKILSVFPDSAIATSANGTLLANIQPNDFVSRR